MVNAVHTSDVMGEEYIQEGKLTPGSGTVGFILAFKDGPSIYYAGDTGVFSDMAIIRELYQPDIAILPVGGKYNMGVPEAGYAAQLLQASIILPIHFDTFPNQKLNFESLVETVKIRAPFSSVVHWVPGDVYEYECG
jgi:L-ascorbate metabolism protein UlaG (beta-lactamase superfamily)